MKTTKQRTGERVRLTEQEMKARDWRRLSTDIRNTLPVLALPGEPLFNESDWALRGYAWLSGCLRLDGSPITGNDGKPRRAMWRRLANGPYHVGVFTIIRDGRWGIAFILDPDYATQRRVRRRRSVGGFDAAFERDFKRRSRAANGTRA